jgi:hypothetical protein
MSADDNNRGCHLTVELTQSPPKKRDIATNVPDVKSVPTTPTLTTLSPSKVNVVTMIKASNGSAATSCDQAMVTSV